MDSLFSLYVGNLNVELAQCRQLIVWFTVDSKISHPSAAIPSPDVGKVVFILICGLWSEDPVR